MKQSVNITLNKASNLFQQCNVELKRKVERLERYSRDFNLRVVGVAEQDGEDCLLIIRNYLTLLGFEDDLGEIENAHRTGRKREEQSKNNIFTITAEIHARSLANFYCQYADRHINLKFMRLVSERDPAIRQFVIVKNKLMSVFNASVLLLIMNFVITLSK